MYKSPNNIFGKTPSRDSYQQFYTTAHANHASNLPLLVVPIYLWGDATHIDPTGRFKSEPWSFSP